MYRSRERIRVENDEHTDVWSVHERADVWSFGITLVELIINQPYFYKLGWGCDIISKKICEATTDEILRSCPGISVHASAFLKQCLQECWKNRSNFKNLSKLSLYTSHSEEQEFNNHQEEIRKFLM